MMILKIILFFAILNACWLVWFILWNPDKNPDRIIKGSIKGSILASIVGLFLAGIITFPLVFLIILSRKRGDKVKEVFFESVNADS